jgi:uncharacterized protein (TIGR00255 family)
MTGFGRGEASAAGLKVEVELSSVNRKQFDLRVNLPRALSALESRVHARVHKTVARGNLSANIRVGRKDSQAGGAVQVDGDTARAYLRELRALAHTLKIKDDLTLSMLVGQPGVIRYEPVPDDTEKIWNLMDKALRTALKNLQFMRRTEGTALQEDITQRLNTLQRSLGVIQKAAPGVSKKRAKVLKGRLQELGVAWLKDDPGLQRDLAMFADRVDISEELTRLDSHFKQARSLLGRSAPVGRALDFVCQEMLREINTIGSKASDAGIAKQVIRFKAELECVREQVQNVE